MAPSSETQRSAAALRRSNWVEGEYQGATRAGGVRLTLRTSTPPMPMTLAPGRTRAICFAAASVFSTLRPMMQAFAPRWTRARVWALQMEPAPPVMKRTRLAVRVLVYEVCESLRGRSPKMPSAQTLLRYSDLGTAIMYLLAMFWLQNSVLKMWQYSSSTVRS